MPWYHSFDNAKSRVNARSSQSIHAMHSLTHSLIYSLTHSLTCSLAQIPAMRLSRRPKRTGSLHARRPSPATGRSVTHPSGKDVWWKDATIVKAAPVASPAPRATEEWRAMPAARIKEAGGRGEGGRAGRRMGKNRGRHVEGRWTV